MFYSRVFAELRQLLLYRFGDTMYLPYTVSAQFMAEDVLMHSLLVN